MLSSQCDQYLFSLNNNNASLREKVTRINEMITKGNMSRLSMIVRVNVVLNRTVIVDSDCVAVIFRLKVSCITSVHRIKLWLLTCK